MPILCPHPHRDRDWQHGETDDGETRNREHEIAHQTMQRTEMLAPQREVPLQPEQRKKYTSQQRSANIIDQRNALHGLLLMQPFYHQPMDDGNQLPVLASHA